MHLNEAKNSIQHGLEMKPVELNECNYTLKKNEKNHLFQKFWSGVIEIPGVHVRKALMWI